MSLKTSDKKFCYVVWGVLNHLKAIDRSLIAGIYSDLKTAIEEKNYIDSKSSSRWQTRAFVEEFELRDK